MTATQLAGPPCDPYLPVEPLKPVLFDVFMFEDVFMFGLAAGIVATPADRVLNEAAEIAFRTDVDLDTNSRNN